MRTSGDDAAPEPSTRLTGAAMAAVVVIWGLGPPITKLISAPALVSVSVRFWISIPILWAMVGLTGRRMSREVLRSTAAAGVLFGVNLVFVFTALQHASVAVIAVIQALQPGVVLLVAGRWLGEQATRWHVIWTVVGVGGVAVVILGGDKEVRSDPVGFLFALAAMLTFTAYYLLNRRVRSTTPIDAVQWMAGVTLFAGLAITPVALIVCSMDDYRQLAGVDWLYLGFIAGAVGIVGHTMMSWVHKFATASRSSLFLLSMNVVAIAAAWPIHDEPITLIQAAGGVVVLGSVAAVVTRSAARPPAAALPTGVASAAG